MNLNEWSVLGVHRIFLITVALALLTASPASAITPPPIDPGALPPDVTGPDQPTEQRVLCASPTTLPGSGSTIRRGATRIWAWPMPTSSRPGPG